MQNYLAWHLPFMAQWLQPQEHVPLPCFLVLTRLLIARATTAMRPSDMTIVPMFSLSQANIFYAPFFDTLTVSFSDSLYFLKKSM